MDSVTIGNATLYHGDTTEILPTLGLVDHIITDPPYSARTHEGHDASASGHNGFGNDGANRKALGYAALTPRDCRPLAADFADLCDGWIVWMCDHHLAPAIQQNLEGLGRYVFAPLPYYAPGSRVRLSGDGPSSWTIWIVVSRTAKQHRWGTLPGGYLHQLGWGGNEHMGGKPLGLMKAVVSDYSRPNDLILDPFMGSGTTGVACAELCRRFIGVEIERKYFDIACERIAKAYAQGDLFIDKPAPQQESLL